MSIPEEMVEIPEEILDFEAEQSDVEDLDDGSAIVRLGPEEEQPADESQFYDNLLLLRDIVIPQHVLDKLASDLLEAIELDCQSREPRDKQYEEGIRRTGIANDTTGGATFNGASKTVHPMITKAAIDFEARAIKEIFPPGGPVKTQIPGDQTPERIEKAQRKSRHMNWQLTKQISEFRSGLEKLLIQLPLGGVQYQRWTWNPRLRRPQPSFVPLDKYVLPYAADDFYTAERRTLIEDITQMEFDQRIADGIYVDENVLSSSVTVPEPTLAEKAAQKVEGKSPDQMNLDGLRRTYETETVLDLSEWDDQANGEARPYIVRLSKDSHRLLGLQRNWEREDELGESMVWTVEWPFIPWRGSMPVGIAQMVGGLSVAATGSLRALLDSAHINNIPTLIKLKGTGQGGQSLILDPTQVNELEGAVGVDDIRKLVMAVPFNEPSLVLYQLLGFLVKEAEGVVRTTFEDFAEQKADMPVGTTLALIEQGMAVISAIHGRLYASMEKTLCVLHRINKMYVTDDDIRDETGELLARREDYQGPVDVIPVADPRIFSEVQRFAQMQVVADRAEKRPAMYDQRKVELLILERLKFPNPEELLTPAPEPKEMNAVNENVAATLGRPVTAFPEQDHLAHLQAHVDYMMSPFFGMLGPVQQVLFPAMLQHLIEHMSLWYASRVFERASAAAGEDFGMLLKYHDPETRQEVDRVLAMASKHVIQEAEQVLQGIPPVIQQVMQIVQQAQQAMQGQDPIAAAHIAVEQVRGQNQQQLEQVRQQDKKEDRAQRIQERMAELKLRVEEGKRQSEDKEQDRSVNMEREQFKQKAETQRSRERDVTNLSINTSDNETALIIAQAEIESGEQVAISKGTGINP